MRLSPSRPAGCFALAIGIAAQLVVGGVHAREAARTVGHSGSGFAVLVERVAPSVVTVMVRERGESAGQRAVDRATATGPGSDVREFLRRLLAGPGAGAPAPAGPTAALGSGFVIRSDGLIVTNRHVIDAARSVRVRLADGRELPATLIGADATTDLALLKVGVDHLPALRLASSTEVKVGDSVIAIGNPFGLGQSVTAGILSARGRTLDDDPYVDFLQTDAAINMGNSGGPLLAMDGSVVGVTTAIFSPSGGSVGLGFAIPAETVRSVVAELEAHGRVVRGYLGISAQPMTPALGQALLGRSEAVGALITAVEPQGPSAGALQAGDVILRLDATPVTFASLGRTVVRLQPGAAVQASVVRDGLEQPLVLKVGQLPDPPADPRRAGGSDTWVPALEIGVANSTFEIRKALNAAGEGGGLIVTQLRPDGAGALAGLRVGDLITHAGSERFADVADFATVSKPSSSRPLLLRVLRAGEPAFVAVTGQLEPAP